MKDIKALYLDAKNHQDSNSVAAYNEAVEELFNDPKSYILESEYIIKTTTGLKTLKPFIEKYGLAIPAYDKILSCITECIDICNRKGITGNTLDEYNEALEFIENYHAQYENCFTVYEYVSPEDFNTNKYINTYYSFSESGHQNRDLVKGMIKEFGESAIPDLMISADAKNHVPSLIKYLESTNPDSNMCELLVEACKDINCKECEDKIEKLKENSSSKIISDMKARNDAVYREAVIMDDDTKMLEYSENEIRALQDLISFKEYQMVAVSDPTEVTRIYNEVMSLYEEFDGLLDENGNLIEHKEFPSFKESECESIHTMMCESLLDMIHDSSFFEAVADGEFKYAYKAAYNYDNGHVLKITYDLSNVIVTDVGIAKPIHDELLNWFKSVDNIMNDDKRMKVIRALATSLNNMIHWKKNINNRKNMITDFLQMYIRKVGYVDFQAKNTPIVSIYDLVDNVELDGPINIVGIYAANDINTNNSLALSEYQLARLHKNLARRSSNFKVQDISVGDVQDYPTFMSTYWDPNSSKNIVNGNGEVVDNDNIDRNNITNIISSNEIFGFQDDIENKKYSDALGDFVEPFYSIVNSKTKNNYKKYDNDFSNKILNKEYKFINNIKKFYDYLSNEENNNSENNTSQYDSALMNVSNILENEKDIASKAKDFIDQGKHEDAYNILQTSYGVDAFKELIQKYSDELQITGFTYNENSDEIDEAAWWNNTSNKKTGSIPGYIINNHNVGYGEVDSKPAKKENDDEDDDIEIYRRPSADKSKHKPLNIDDDNNEDNDISNHTNIGNDKSDDKAVNNYYYYTYTNSLNRNDNSFNRSTSDNHSVNTTDDHSTDKGSNNKYNSYNRPLPSSKENDDKDTKPAEESLDISKPNYEKANPWELNIFNDEVYNEATGDADDDKPQSDHPVKDTLTDIQVKTNRAQQAAKKKVQDAQNVGRAFMKPIKRTAQWVTQMCQNWKDYDENRIKEKLADPKARKGLFNAIAFAIKTGALYKAGVLFNPVFMFLSATKHIGNKKKESRLRAEMVGELKTELEILDEKIHDADEAHDNQAKYQLMRFKNELNKKLLRVGGNVDADRQYNPKFSKII